MNSVRKSLAFSALDSYLGMLLQIVSTVIIARILTPAETGVFAVAAVFAALASTFRDFGVAEYLIQERDLNDDAIRASLTVNMAVSWLMALLLFGAAPWAAEFYRAQGVADVMRVQSLNFLLIPFGAVTLAWFRREMNLQPIFIAGLLANIASFVVAIVLALRGFGAMSLAWSSLAGVAVTVGVSVWMRPLGFPLWPGLRGVGKVLQFGKFASGIYIFGQLGKGAPEMVIGRAQDMTAVGLFSRANGLVEIFNRLVLRSVLPVCLPYFARSVRECGSPVPSLLTTMGHLTVIGWPFLGFLAIAAHAVIELMYGDQWLAVVSLSRLLCAAAALELLYYPAKEAMLAVGRAKECNQLQIVLQGLRLAGLMAVVPWGLHGAAWGLFAAALLGAFASHIYLARTTGLRVADVLRALVPSLVVSASAMAPLCALAVLWPFDGGNGSWAAILGASLTLLSWVFALMWMKHPLWSEILRLQRGALAWARQRMSRQPPAK